MSSQPHLAAPQLNATPLIDVLLVLLIMLIFTLPVATHAVKLNLPHGPVHAPPAVVRLEILSPGYIYWNGEYVASIAALAPKFAAVTASTDPPLVKVMPERRASYERVAQVLAAAQRSHVEKLTVTPVTDL